MGWGNPQNIVVGTDCESKGMYTCSDDSCSYRKEECPSNFVGRDCASQDMYTCPDNLCSYKKEKCGEDCANKNMKTCFKYEAQKGYQKGCFHECPLGWGVPPIVTDPTGNNLPDDP